MRKSSSISSINIYLRQEAKLLGYNHSPHSTKLLPRALRASLPNIIAVSPTSRTQKQSRFSQANCVPPASFKAAAAFKTPGVANPQQSPEKGSSLQDFHSALSSKLQQQNSKFRQLQTASRLKQDQARRSRSSRSKLATRQAQRNMQQIQQKCQESRREQELILARNTHERSIILEMRQESLRTLRKQRENSARSEMRLTRDRYYETERQHEFLVLKNKTAKMQQNYEISYQRAFVKNQPFKIGKYPSFSTLGVSAKAFSSNKKLLLPQLKGVSQKQSYRKQTVEIGKIDKADKVNRREGKQKQRAKQPTKKDDLNSLQKNKARASCNGKSRQ